MSQEATQTTNDEIAQAEPAKLFKILRKDPEPPPVPEIPVGVKESDVVVGGRTDREISLNPDVKADCLDVVTTYKTALSAMQERGEPLTPAQERLLNSAVDEQLRAGNLSREGMLALQRILRTEVGLKASSMGVEPRNTPAVFKEVRFPFIWSRKPVEELPTTTLVPVETRVRTESEYLKQIGFNTLTREQQEDNLFHQNNLLMDVEQSFFGDGYRNDFFQGDNVSGFPRTAESTNGTYLQIEERRQADEILKERGITKSLAELYSEDPAVAEQLSYEAADRAFLMLTRKEGQEALRGNEPTVKPETLNKHAEALRKKPDPEDKDKILEPLIDAARKVDDKYTKLRTSVDSLKEQLTVASQSYEAAEVEMRKADGRKRTAEADLPTQIKESKARLDAIVANINTPAPTGLTAKEIATYENNRQKAAATVKDAAAEYHQLQEKLKLARDQYTDTAADAAQKRRERKRISDQLTIDEAALTAEKPRKEAADLALKKKQDELAIEKDAPQERLDQADAVETWGKLLEGGAYASIFEARYSTKRESPYSRNRIGSANA